MHIRKYFTIASTDFRGSSESKLKQSSISIIPSSSRRVRPSSTNLKISYLSLTRKVMILKGTIFILLSKKKLIKSPLFLLGLLVASLLSSACSTLQQYQFSAPSTLESNSLPLPHQNPKKQCQSCGDSLKSPAETKSPPQSPRGTSVLSASPLWEL